MNDCNTKDNCYVLNNKCITLSTGSQLLETLEHGANDDEDAKLNLEENLRKFIDSALKLERKVSRETNANTFSYFEIRALMLVNALKSSKSKELGSSGKKKIVLAKFVNPFENLQKHEYQCPKCPKKFDASSIKSLQFHYRTQHKDEEKLEKQNFEEVMVECILKTKDGSKCGKKYPRDQITRHLLTKRCHLEEQQKPADKNFRGFRIIEGNIEIVWKSKTEPNPPSEVEIEVQIGQEIGETEKENGKKEEEAKPKPRQKTIKEYFGKIEFGSVAKKKEEEFAEKADEMPVDSLKTPFQIDLEEENSVLDGDQQGFSPPISTPHLPVIPVGYSDNVQPQMNLKIEDITVNSQQTLEGLSIELIPEDQRQIIVLRLPDDNEGSIFRTDKMLTTGAGDLSMEDLRVSGEEESGSIEEVQNWKLEVDLETEGLFQNSSVAQMESQESLLNQRQVTFVNPPDLLGKDRMEEEVYDIHDDSLNQVVTSQERIEGCLEQVSDEIGGEKEKLFNDELEEDCGFESDESDDIEVDSDYNEDLDDKSTTKKRQERKITRHMNRNNLEPAVDQTELPENKLWIRSFMKWLEDKTAMQTTNPKPSTLDFARGHGFEYWDSFLNYMVSKNKTFNLSRLTDFRRKENFLLIESPVGWLSAAAGGNKTSNPNRQRIQLNVHKSLRDFILHQLHKTSLDGNQIIQTLVVTNHLKSIDDEVSGLKLYKKCSSLYEKERLKTRKMKNIVNPSNDKLELDCVKTWLSSETAKTLEIEVRRICQDAAESGSIKARDFGKVANFVRFTLAIQDKNRPSTYEFTNFDYKTKKAVWIPEDQADLWGIENLPPGWDIYQAPEDNPDAPPSSFEIVLDGSQSGIKSQAETTVVFDMKTFELLELYQDIKKILLKKKMKPNSKFFVNHKGSALSRMQRSKGSIVEKFGTTVGLKDFKMTSIRKSLEGNLAGSSQAGRSKEINNHSNLVGSTTYDNAKSMRRSCYMTAMASTEAPPAETVDKNQVRHHYATRRKMEKNEMEEIQDEAKEYLEAKRRKKDLVDLTPTSLGKDDVNFIRSLFTDEDLKGESYTKYHLMIVFSKMFCRGEVQKLLLLERGCHEFSGWEAVATSGRASISVSEDQHFQGVEGGLGRN